MLELRLIDSATLERVALTCKHRDIDILKVLGNYAGMSVDEIKKTAEMY